MRRSRPRPRHCPTLLLRSYSLASHPARHTLLRRGFAHPGLLPSLPHPSGWSSWAPPASPQIPVKQTPQSSGTAQLGISRRVGYPLAWHTWTRPHFGRGSDPEMTRIGRQRHTCHRPKRLCADTPPEPFSWLACSRSPHRLGRLGSLCPSHRDLVPISMTFLRSWRSRKRQRCPCRSTPRGGPCTPLPGLILTPGRPTQRIFRLWQVVLPPWDRSSVTLPASRPSKPLPRACCRRLRIARSSMRGG